MKKCSQRVFFFIITFSSCAFGQVQTTIDSLKRILATTTDSKLRAGIYKELVSEWAEANFDSSYKYANQMRIEARQLNDKPFQIKALLALGVTHDYHNNIDSAKHYYIQARLVSLENNDDENAARADFNLATLEYAAGNYLSAIEVYRRTEQLFRKLNNERALSRIYNNLGQVFLRSEQYESAAAYFKQSIDIKEKLNDAKGKMNSLTNLAVAYQKAGKYEEAKTVAKTNALLAQSLADSLAYRNELSNLGEIYQLLNKSDSAFICWRQAESLVSSSDPSNFTGNLWANLADFHLQRKEYSQAKAYIEKTKKVFEVDPDLKLRYLKLQSNYFSGVNQFEQAFQFQRELMNETQKQTSEKVLKKLKEYEVLFDSEKKERQISSLELEKKEVALTLQQQAFQRNILFAIATGLFVIAGLIFWQYKQKQKINNELNRALADREILLKEIHHRVKNNLQVISSLLNLQSKSVKDKSAHDAVIEGRNRVKSMSMIHEHLYQKNNLAGIAMQEYVQELCDSLMRSYGIDSERIQTNISTGSLNLDVDTAIPIGLILNELITNSLKYAFPEDSKGVIQVSLKEQHNKLLLHISDNGIGKSSLNETHGFGTELVGLLAEKLKASLSNQSKQGTSTELLIAKYKIVNTV
jgi:two-component system, sensor histidine kinase PdtaS